MHTPPAASATWSGRTTAVTVVAATAVTAGTAAEETAAPAPAEETAGVAAATPVAAKFDAVSDLKLFITF